MGTPRFFLLAAAIWCSPALVTAGPSAPTLEAWNAYVRATEARRAREAGSATGFFARDFSNDGSSIRRAALEGELIVDTWQTPDASGQSREVPQGQIHHWVGTVFVPGVSLDILLDRLHGTEVHSRQPDVVAARVLGRSPDGLSLYLRLRRAQIITVTYDSEHRVTFERLDGTKAASTSVATRIVEVDDPGTDREHPRAPGDDRGFLWRLNAYWRYQAVAGGVLVECESISLSRRVPPGLGFVAGPFITRVARESMLRTLETLRGVLGRPAVAVASRRGAL